MANLKCAVFLIFLIISIILVNASPPELPVIIYGKAVYENSKGVPGIKLQIKYFDNSNIAKQKEIITTSSKSIEENGFYKLELNDVPEESEVQIIYGSDSIKVIAKKGFIIKAPDLVIKNRGFFGKIFENIKDIFSKDEDLDKEIKKESTTYNESREEDNQINNTNINITDKEKLDDKSNFSENESTGKKLLNESLNITESLYKTKKQNQSLDFKINFTRSPIIKNFSSEMFFCEGSEINKEINIDYPGYLNLNYILIHKEESSPIKMDLSSKNQNNIIFYSDVLRKKLLSSQNEGYKTYEEEFSVDDNIHIDIKKFNITIIAINNAPKINKIGVLTAETNKLFYYKIITSDIEDRQENLLLNVSFSLQKLFNINDNIIEFFPKENQIGNHKISICISDNGINNPHKNISLCDDDGKPKQVCEEFNLTITKENKAPKITNSYPENNNIEILNEKNISFSIDKEDSDGTIPDSYWYIDNNLLQYYEGIKQDQLIYNIPCSLTGNHIIKVDITDGLINDSKKWNVSISEDICRAKKVKRKINLGFISNIFVYIIVFIAVILSIFVIILVIRAFRLKNRINNVRKKM